jgi:hypothetical protein
MDSIFFTFGEQRRCDGGGAQFCVLMSLKRWVRAAHGRCARPRPTSVSQIRLYKKIPSHHPFPVSPSQIPLEASSCKFDTTGFFGSGTLLQRKFLVRFLTKICFAPNKFERYFIWIKVVPIDTGT